MEGSDKKYIGYGARLTKVGVRRDYDGRDSEDRRGLLLSYCVKAYNRVRTGRIYTVVVG